MTAVNICFKDYKGMLSTLSIKESLKLIYGAIVELAIAQHL